MKPKLADANYVFIARKFTMRLVTNKSFARCWYFDLQFSILHGISRCRISTAWKLRERNELRILDGGKEINFQKKKKKNTAIKKIVQFPSFAMIRLIYASIETFSFRKNTWIFDIHKILFLLLVISIVHYRSPHLSNPSFRPHPNVSTHYIAHIFSQSS